MGKYGSLCVGFVMPISILIPSKWRRYRDVNACTQCLCGAATITQAVFVKLQALTVPWSRYTLLVRSLIKPANSEGDLWSVTSQYTVTDSVA